MKKLIKIFSITLFTIALSCTASTVFAQEDFEDGGASDTEDVPIDGGISLLVAAGVGYGAKKLNDKRKKEQAAGEGEAQK